jgi:hypothetical protein
LDYIFTGIRAGTLGLYSDGSGFRLLTKTVVRKNINNTFGQENKGYPGNNYNGIPLFGLEAVPDETMV